ncbi:MAG TPA: chromate transporter [Bacillota bacterium]|nr:chromate transporter [Bacillota bacterium]HOL11226.1 chromate transporter [Bacillota bacterium]HPO98934.1 chromate transporter [Bacillota bacterium]
MDKQLIKTLWRMFIIFFRIGAFTIGGGYAMLPLIEQEVVDKEKWISAEDIVDVFAVSQAIPGVISINSSMIIGYKVAGLPGIIVASLGVILPSFITILLIAYLLINIRDNVYIIKAFNGVRAGVTALIALSAVKLGQKTIRSTFGVILAISAFIAVIIFDVHASWTILLGGLLGLLVFGLKGNKQK